MTLNLFTLCPVSLSSEELAGHLAEVTDLLIRLHASMDDLPPARREERAEILFQLCERRRELREEVRDRPARQRRVRLHDWLGLPPSHPMLELRWGHVSPR